jgi:DNA invertase Pin-like site-specific DNA recombinase
MGQLLGYARVSTGDQQSHLQVDALERAGCHQVLTETASAASADRPVLGQVLDRLRLASGVLVSPEARRPRARQRRRSP